MEFTKALEAIKRGEIVRSKGTRNMSYQEMKMEKNDIIFRWVSLDPQVMPSDWMLLLAGSEWQKQKEGE
ncbi:hypothetical protein LCGC14_2538860 [marine sediment metagenome]|uniref:Uncharacterized protein n=1 Tax=marine sediment metagenome TaxID=412755 RepID=A0A0F9ARP7_9ZZZZ